MQRVTLTPEERQVVLDYAARLEKRSRHWRAWRWLAVGCFVFGLVLLLAVDRLGAKMRSTMELPPEALKILESAESKSVGSSLRLLASHSNVQATVLRAEFYLVIRVLIVAGIGTGLFVYVVSDWARDRRDRLVVRLLRSVVSDSDDQKHES